MGISRQAHYKRQAHERRRSEQATTVVELVDAKRRQQPRIGTRKLHYLLKRPLGDAGIKLGRDALFDILRDARMLVLPRRAYHKTTNSHHHYRRHPNPPMATPNCSTYGRSNCSRQDGWIMTTRRL
jgi:putative transposase